MRLLSNNPDAVKQREWRKRKLAADPDYLRKKYAIYNAKRRKKAHSYRRNPGSRWTRAKLVAGYEGREFTLTEEQYCSLIKNPCHYCGQQLPSTGRGLDRIDNNLGYAINNVLPSCAQCNQTRNRFYTVEETKVMINALLKFRASKGAL